MPGSQSLASTLLFSVYGNGTGASSGVAWYTSCPNCIVIEPANIETGPFNLDTTIIRSGTPSSSNQMIQCDGSSFPTAAWYIIRDLYIDGNFYAGNGVLSQNCHHIAVLNNYIRRNISSGIDFGTSDYDIALNNVIVDNGYNPNNVTGYATSCSSGISFNLLQEFDSYAGLHNVACGNYVVSSFCHTSQHSDGNAIVIDNSANSTTPATLICNNLAVGNGGRSFEADQNQSNGTAVTSGYYFDNTSYYPGLDLTGNNPFGAFVIQDSSNIYTAGNLSQVWPGSHTYGESSGNNIHYQQVNSPGNVTNAIYSDTNWYVSGEDYNFTPTDPTQFLNFNPLFVNPNLYSSTAGLQWMQCGDSGAPSAPDCTPAPETFGSDYYLQAGSPAIGAGIDPTTITGIPAQVASDMALYVYTDILGNSRPVGGPFDLGAYQVPVVANPIFSPPAGAFTGSVSVALTDSTSGSTICYLAGSCPITNDTGTCVSGTAYSAPINVTLTETLYAVGTKSGNQDSSCVSASYSISSASPAAHPTVIGVIF